MKNSAANKDGFVLYKSFYAPIKTLSNEQLGRLFRAIFCYQINCDETVDDDIKMAFSFFKNQMDIEDAKYIKTIERNRLNGTKGGRPKKAEKPKKPSGLKKTQKTQWAPIGKDMIGYDSTVSSTSTPNVVEDTGCRVVDSDVYLVEDQNAGAREEPEVEIAQEVTWRDSFDAYLIDLRAAWKKLVSDQQWMDDRQRFNPGVDIKLTLEKACKEFWATEAGWKHKKKSRSKAIDWGSTLASAVSLKSNRVYDRRDNSNIRNSNGVSYEFERQVDAILGGSSPTALPQNEDPNILR